MTAETMNIPNCKLDLTTSTPSEWRGWVRGLTNEQLTEVPARINQFGLKAEAPLLPMLERIRQFAIEEMAKRFTGILTLLHHEQAKVAQLSRQAARDTEALRQLRVAQIVSYHANI